MSAPTRVLIVDDEPIARSILEEYVARLPLLTLAGSCANAVEALQIMREQHVDLLLLDIDMPQVNGMSLLKSLQVHPAVIFTTAYAEYAVESYEHNAMDYLLKPVRFERFLRAINKLNCGAPKPAAAFEEALTQQSAELIFVKAEGKLIKIDLSEVLFIEGLKDYAAIHFDKGKLVVHSTMKALEERLSTSINFLRIHKSYIINLKFVTEIDGPIIRVGGKMLSIGNTYRDAVSVALERLKLN